MSFIWRETAERQTALFRFGARSSFAKSFARSLLQRPVLFAYAFSDRNLEDQAILLLKQPALSLLPNPD